MLKGIVFTDFLCGLTTYDECLIRCAASNEYRHVLSLVMNSMWNPVCLDDENAEQLYKSYTEIYELLMEVKHYFDATQMDRFCRLWLENHALLFDLQRLRQKMERNRDIDVETFLAGRASYIAFFYNEYFPEPLDGHITSYSGHF